MQKMLYFRVQNLYLLIFRSYIAKKFRKRNNLKIYYGCGANFQKGYINVDIRWTPTVDLLANLKWCSRFFEGRCQEVYLSHVLEHYNYPGKNLSLKRGTILDALNDVNKMLVNRGTIRLAVPDFHTLSELYISGGQPLFPRLTGRICGEQNYPQNLHRCVFDRDFLALCLEKSGFTDLIEWDPEELGFERDSSFDCIGDVKTSLNLAAKKSSAFDI